VKQVKTFRFSEAEVALLDALSGEFGAGSEADALRSVVADGLRHRMEQGEPPIAPLLVETLKDEAVVEEYLNYLDAVRERAGLNRPDGSPPQHHFVQVPAGGTWESRCCGGGWMVVHKSVRLTPQGFMVEV